MTGQQGLELLLLSPKLYAQKIKPQKPLRAFPRS